MIGRLRHRAGLYVPNEVPDAAGGHDVQWVFYKQVWADFQPRTSTERGEHGRLVVIQSYRVVIRFQPDFPERVRVMWDDRILRVLSTSDPDTRRERLHLICEEEVQ